MIVSGEQQDRRNLFRMCIDCPVQITGLSEGSEAIGRVLDLSGSGLAVTCSETFLVGDTFQVKVVPDKPVFMPLVADVEVVRVDEGADGASVYGLKIRELLS